MRLAYKLLLFTAVVSANPVKSEVNNESRIIGGQATTIDHYPFMVAMLRLWSIAGDFGHSCGGSIINSQTILSAAQCFYLWPPAMNPAIWRMRVGSTYAHSGGVVHTISQIILHPDYIPYIANDIGLARVDFFFQWSPTVQQVSIAGPNYNVADNQIVWTAGWGSLNASYVKPEELHHVQMYTINFELCNERNFNILRPNVICAGVLDVDDRNFCIGDEGGPLLHNGVAVGVADTKYECGNPHYPGVHAKVAYFSDWIVANA